MVYINIYVEFNFLLLKLKLNPQFSLSWFVVNKVELWVALSQSSRAMKTHSLYCKIICGTSKIVKECTHLSTSVHNKNITLT